MAGLKIPENLRTAVGDAVDELTSEIQQQELYAQVMKQVVDGFKAIEEQAAKYSVTEAQIVEAANTTLEGVTIRSIDELFMLRSFDVARIAAGENGRHLLLAATEGAVTGAPGFAGLPFNIVFSMFLYYRAVQSVAMMYGFNVKEDPAEMVIAGDVFSNAMAPSAGSADGMAVTIGKVMLVAEMEGVKQTVKKGWTAMAARGGAAMLVTQIAPLLMPLHVRHSRMPARSRSRIVFSKTYSNKLAGISLKNPSARPFPCLAALSAPCLMSRR